MTPPRKVDYRNSAWSDLDQIFWYIVEASGMPRTAHARMSGESRLSVSDSRMRLTVVGHVTISRRVSGRLPSSDPR